MQNNYEVLKMFLEELSVSSEYILTIDEYRENGKFDIQAYDSTVLLITHIICFVLIFAIYLTSYLRKKA